MVVRKPFVVQSKPLGWPRLPIAIGIACYLVSFFLPVAVERGNQLAQIPDSKMYGYEVFVLTMMPGLSTYTGDGRFFLSWLANVAFVATVGFYLSNKRDISLFTGVIAAILASIFLDNRELLIGYYVWVASMYLTFVSSFIKWKFP